MDALKEIEQKTQNLKQTYANYLSYSYALIITIFGGVLGNFIYSYLAEVSQLFFFRITIIFFNMSLRLPR